MNQCGQINKAETHAW